VVSIVRQLAIRARLFDAVPKGCSTIEITNDVKPGNSCSAFAGIEEKAGNDLKII